MNPISLSRRQVLAGGLAATAALLLPSWLGGTLQAGDGDPPVRPKRWARSVIQVWLSGGYCHLDTFDPKPGAGRDYCGPLGKPIPTAVDGLQFSQLLPLLAQQAGHFSVLRGCTHGNNGHETATYMTQTGRKSGGELVHPGLGAALTCLDQGYKGKLPPYIVLTRPLGRFSESGFLGPKYLPFATGGDPSKEVFAVEGIVSERVSTERQQSRRTLLHDLDVFAGNHAEDPLVARLATCREQAYDLILGDAGKVFALDGEPAALRDRYGRSAFGQSCLLARRLVEQGVPYITINLGGWDTHKQHFQAMNKKLPELDAGLATLFDDLAQHGLLDQTAVWVGSEFGRTPKVLWEPPWNGGRGHHGQAFSMLLGGGGFVGGKVVGTTDEHGEKVVQRPIWPWDLIESVHDRLGLLPTDTLPLPRGGKIAISALQGEAIAAKERGGLLREIMR